MTKGKRWVSAARHLPEACHSLVTRLTQGDWTTHETSNDRHNLTVTAEDGDVVYFHLDAVRPELQMVHVVGGRRTGRLVFPSGGIPEMRCDPAGVDAMPDRIMAPVARLMSMPEPNEAENAQHDAAVERLMKVASCAVIGSGLDFEKVRFLDLANPWAEAHVSTPDPMGNGIDGVVTPEWAEAVARTGDALPAIVKYTTPAAPASEMLYDTTIGRMTLVVDPVDVLEAMRIAKDLA